MKPAWVRQAFFLTEVDWAAPSAQWAAFPANGQGGAPAADTSGKVYSYFAIGIGGKQ